MMWISVEERLPEDATDEDTFFISDGENISIGWFETDSNKYTDGVWHEEGIILNNICGAPVPHVTHWMPFFLEPPDKEVKE